MSEVKVNKITPRAACGTTQLGDSGDTFTIPSGATITNAGTASGFGATGAVSWNTTKITADPSPAVTGTGYFCDTSGAAFTVTLPASPTAGDVIGVSDYAKTFQTNTLTLDRNGSNIGGAADDAILSTEGVAVTLVYVDSTKGWIVTDSGLQSDAPGPLFVAATGGTPSAGAIVCTNYKQHTFTGPGTLVVSCGGNSAGSNTVDYLIVAGGGAGGKQRGAGGGAGGYRESPGTASGCYSVSPLGASPAVALPVSATPYAITVGGGGTGSGGSPSPSDIGASGGNSVFSTITSAGGGKAKGSAGEVGEDGGSGGGGMDGAGSSGNTPATSPPQGQDGGAGAAAPNYGAGGGGGAGGIGSDGSTTVGGVGGAGATSSINATPTARSGGGGGSTYSGGTPGPAHPGGGGGGAGGSSGGCGGAAGTVNTGGGGGGGYEPGPDARQAGGAGGSGVVVIRYKYQ